ncbi:chorismate mutase [Novosphingobium sp. RD2P27]|uniref:chorismate mutase n=1 Tax=Novosphingobium kalidii TaxID=3230299 RepID=A0ABV2D313_9SPHN
MPDTSLPPEACQTMADVRAGVDELDARLVDMLATRFAYMRAAARIKPERTQVRDEGRKAQVIANARSRAEAFGLPGEAVAAMWDDLVEASIAYELSHWDGQRQG